MIRILFVEDDQRAIEEALELCKEGIENSDIKVCGFEDASGALRAFQPDVVILDILRGSPSEGDEAGKEAYGFIWDTRFCPIVVYSAEPDRLDDKEHPFVAKVEKGRGSEDRVLQEVQKFLPHVQAAQRTESEVRQRLSEAMREVAPFAFRSFDDATKREEIIMRLGRRRVAAKMDDPPTGEGSLTSWECYLYPPVSQHTLLGDVLERNDGDGNPESFRIVLAPSCDMVRSEGRTPNVQEVLVAKCCSMQEALSLIGLRGNTNTNRIRERLLSSGYAQSVIPFPAMGGVIPAMAANLRSLELIPIGSIGEESSFRRVASLDSPFRELVAWAYLQNAGRPGLPDRDLDAWAREIVDTLSPEQ